jgi:hypothetical protein
MVEGDIVPEWGGVWDPQRGYYAGLPGKAFATDTSRYVFTAGLQNNISVRVRLLYRRAYRSLADQKGWDIPDILMAEQVIKVR